MNGLGANLIKELYKKDQTNRFNLSHGQNQEMHGQIFFDYRLSYNSFYSIVPCLVRRNANEGSFTAVSSRKVFFSFVIDLRVRGQGFRYVIT